MGGFFGFFDYSKPGPGIPKDAPPKPRPIVFFEIFTRKFWNLVKLNMMFLLFNLPAIVAAMWMTWVFLQQSLGESLFVEFSLRFILASVTICLPIITIGPVQAGFTYVLRNYAREEHAWIWWDFKENALKNLKESLIICLIDFLVVYVVGIDFNIYLRMNNGNFLVIVANVILVMLFTVYMMMHLYIYPMLVTFKLTVRQIYKNAFIFSIMNFFKNLGILLLCGGVMFVSFINPYIGFILFPFITVSTIGLITNFYVYPYLKKYLIDKLEEQANVSSGESKGTAIEG